MNDVCQNYSKKSAKQQKRHLSEISAHGVFHMQEIFG